jgi:hypothetical protein
MIMDYNFAKRVQANSPVLANDATEAGKALHYFEKIFGAYSTKGSKDFSGDTDQGWVTFKRLKVGKCDIQDARLKLQGTDLSFECSISTPLLDMSTDARYVDAFGKTADKLIDQYKKGIQRLITDQEEDIAEDQKSLAFLKSLTK